MNDSDFNPKKTVYQDMVDVEETHWWYVGLRELLSQTIKSLDVTKTLDAGCGTGRNIMLYNSLNLETYGFDYSKESLEICKSRNLKNIKQGSIIEIPYDEKSFDLVTCLDVLSAIPESKLNKAISEFNRVLKKDKYLILNEAALPWAVSKHFNDWDLKQRFYLQNLERILKENNFEIIKGTYRVTFLFPPIIISRFLERFGNNISNHTPDVHKTNYFINIILSVIMKFENFLIRYLNFPIGNSIFIVAKKI